MSRRMLTLLLLTGAFAWTFLLQPQPPTESSSPTPVPYAIPTPLPRIYRQTEINRMLILIEETYGIGFAYPAEWQASNAGEVMLLADYLHTIYETLNTAAYYLYLYGDAPISMNPGEFFRQNFDAAHIAIDRAIGIPGGFSGNTLPVYEKGQVAGYAIQLTPASMSGPYVLVHELGHVLDNLLDDVPHQQFVKELGGEFSPEAWIPGAGYSGNENLFPRAVSGPNEDFADTFAQMLVGTLSPHKVRIRYEFMRKHLPIWLEAARNLPPNSDPS